MNKLLTVFLLSLPLSLTALASEFKQGKHYDIIADINSFAVINAGDYMKQQQTRSTEQRVLEGVPSLLICCSKQPTNALFRLGK
jgi:hypothetical protein